jgi:hypothetical protein
MSAIKEIVDLTVKLLESKAASKFAGEVRQIQLAVATLQSEHAAIIERDTNLLAENLELKRKMGQMDDSHTKAITALQEKHRQEIANLEKQIEQLKAADVNAMYNSMDQQNKKQSEARKRRSLHND